MFIIQHASKLYFHNKGRIILYETRQEAESFLDMFIQYSTSRLAQMGKLSAAMQTGIIIMNECEIKPAGFDIENVKCGVAWMKELFDKR